MCRNPVPDAAEFIKGCMNKYRDVTSTNILDAFSCAARANPNHLAIRYGDIGLNYEQLDRLSDCIAQGLSDSGIKPRGTVGIYLDKSHRFVVSIIGILKAGCAYLPLAKLYPPKRIQDIISLSGMTGVIAEEGADALFQHISCFHYDDLSHRRPLALTNEKTSYDDLAYIVFTSGSTGVPKGIAVKHGNVINLIYAIQHDLFGSAATDPRIITMVSSFTFDMSVFQMYYALLFGKTLVLVDDEKKNSMEYIADCLDGNNVDLVDMTPVLFRMFIEHMERRQPPLNLPGHFILSGEALPISMLKRFFSLKGSEDTKVHNAYGPTETCVYATAHTFDKLNVDKYERMIIGKPLSNNDVYILNGEMNPCATFEEGEIYISGLNVSAGYINQPEVTRKAFLPDRFHEGRIMYRTGDLGCYTEKGIIECHGRVDDQVKLRGYRIELGDIAKHVEDIRGITQCVVRMLENENEKFMVAYFTHTENISLFRIQKELGESLPQYMIPSYYVPVDGFRMGLSGKIDKSALPDYKTCCLREIGDIGENNDATNDLDPDKKEFLCICRQVFDRNDITLNDSLVYLGGSSLTLHIILMKVWHRWGKLISLADLYKCSSLYEMSVCLEKEKTSEAEQEMSAGYELPLETEITSVLQDMFDLKHAADIREFSKRRANYSSFHVIHSVCIKEYIDCERLESALAKMIVRHNAFRITFTLNHSKWKMHLHEKCDCSVMKRIYTQGHITRDILLENTKAFDEALLPLLQLILFEDPEGRQVIMLNAHHAVFDFISLEVFLSELFAFYDNDNLPPLNMGFYEYACRDAKEAVRRNRSFWKEYIRGRHRAVLFSGNEPVFNHLSITETNVFNNIHYELNGEVLNVLRKSAVRYNATPYIILLALLALYMSRCSGCHDVMIGTNLNGRETAHEFELIGMFTTQACIRILVDDSCDFSDYITKCKENAADIMKHQAISLSDIYKSQHMTDMSKGALYHVFVNYFPVKTIDLRRRGERAIVEILDEDPGFCPFELKFIENHDEICVEVKYLAEVFNIGEIKKIVSDYFSLIGKLAEIPASGISIQTFMGRARLDESYL